MDKLTSVAYIYYKNYKHHTHNFVKNEINKAKSPNKVLCKQCQFLGGFDPGVQAGFDSFNIKGFQETDRADRNYCCRVARIEALRSIALWTMV